MEKRISSTDAARLIGIRTQTLAKWRWLGKGPTGWVRISPTHVTYPVSAIEKFIAQCGAAEEPKE
jgi:hypothetical protein